jgi:ligand-binding sensor domain-containing protein
MKKYITILALALVLITCKDDEPKKETFIVGNHVLTIVIDDDAIRWFGTRSGISSFDGETWVNYTYKDGLPSDTVVDIDVRQLGLDIQILAATRSGIGILNTDLNIVNSIVSINMFNSDIRSNDVLSIMEDYIGGTWIGTMEGLNVHYKNKWLISETDSIVKDYAITDIAPGPDTISYVCFYGKGIALMDLEVDALTTVTYYQWPASPLPSVNIQAIYVDGYDYQWIGTDNGLAFHGNFDPSKDWHLYDESDGLIDNFVLSVTSDKDGIAWIGTISGVSRFDGQNWTNYTTEDGLAGDMVYCIAIDHDNSVWFGTNNGASHLVDDEWYTYRTDQNPTP